jgi:hypothetical protein
MLSNRDKGPFLPFALCAPAATGYFALFAKVFKDFERAFLKKLLECGLGRCPGTSHNLVK